MSMPPSTLEHLSAARLLARASRSLHRWRPPRGRHRCRFCAAASKSDTLRKKAEATNDHRTALRILSADVVTVKDQLESSHTSTSRVHQIPEFVCKYVIPSPRHETCFNVSPSRHRRYTVDRMHRQTGRAEPRRRRHRRR